MNILHRLSLDAGARAMNLPSDPVVSKKSSESKVGRRNWVAMTNER